MRVKSRVVLVVLAFVMPPFMNVGGNYGVAGVKVAVIVEMI